MKESRIKRNTLILLGVMFLLLIGMVLTWYFLLVRPQQQKLAELKTNYDTQLQAANQLKPALSGQRKAEDRLKYISGQVEMLRNRYRNFYFGDIGASYNSETPPQKANREAIWRNLMNYYYNGYGPALRDELQRYATRNDVRIISSIAVVSPPNKPEDVSPPPSGVLRPLSGSATTAGAPNAGERNAGTTPAALAGSADGGGSLSVTVTGTLPNLLRYFNDVNHNATLVKVGTIKLDTDPGPPLKVRATFTMTPYLLAVGPGAPVGDSAAATEAAPSGRLRSGGGTGTTTASAVSNATTIG